MADRPLRILVPLPDRDFDTTESSVVWDALDTAGHEVVFATEHGAVAECDRHLLGPGWLNPFPAEPVVVATYHCMTAAPNFRRPIRYSEIDASEFDAVHLPGGHSPGMKQYLGSRLLQEKVATFDAAGKPIGAVCHGVLVPARARNQKTGKSLLAGRTVTTLIKPIEQYAFRSRARFLVAGAAGGGRRIDRDGPVPGRRRSVCGAVCAVGRECAAEAHRLTIGVDRVVAPGE